MEEAPDPNEVMAYVMVAIYCLLVMLYWLGTHDDTETDEKAAKPQAGETSGAHLARVGLGRHVGLDIEPPAPAGKPAYGFDTENDDTFLPGARRAYGMIVGAFAAGNLGPLEGLVADDVLEGFGAVIAERWERGERATVEIVSIKTAVIERVDTDTEQVEVTVRFQTQQVTALFNAEGVLVAGNPQALVEVTDLWRFARRHDSTNPDWVLVATDGE